MLTLYQGALAVRRNGRVFQIPCEMQRGLELLPQDYTKKRNKRERGHSFGVWRHSATKESGLRAHSGGFLQTRAYSTLQCANLWPFLLPS